jgi:hypothetical protein
MTERVAELLIQAVQQLSPPERDELLGELVRSTLARSEPPMIDPLAGDVAGSVVAAGIRAGPTSRMGTRPSLTTKDTLSEDPALKVLPVRLPAGDYERLRAFSREHGFSMAVIIRTLVERFLDGQARRWSSRRDEPDDADGALDDQNPSGHA